MSDSGQDATDLVPSAAPSEAGWRLIELRTSRVHAVPLQGLVIGRSDECDLVLSSKGVSRRHAVIRRAGTGLTVTDESSNGTFVNDTRVERVQTLARGDRLRIGGDVFHVDVAPRGSGAPGDATEVIPSVPDSMIGGAAPRVGRASSAALATFEVTRGPLAGERYTVSRPVCAIGKSGSNDIVVADDTVSASHATLMLKADRWYVVDLRSSNGTFVDGYRIAGERELPPGATLTLGAVKMIFRPASRLDDAARETPRPIGMLGKLGKLFGR